MKLITAVGTLLAGNGFTGLGVNAVAREAGVDKVLIYRYFGGLPELITAYGQEGDFWPSMDELTGGDVDHLMGLPVPQRFSRLGRNFLDAIRKRPVTQEILAWELVESNKLTETLETIREASTRKMLKLFVPSEQVEPDLEILLALLGAALTYLVVRARKARWYSGIDLHSEIGWLRLEKAIERIVQGLINKESLCNT